MHSRIADISDVCTLFISQLLSDGGGAKALKNFSGKDVCFLQCISKSIHEN
jgi:hypothetical protein